MRNRKWEVWKDNVLIEPVKRVVFAPGMERFSKQSAIESFNCNERRPEVCGYLEGFVINSEFYVISNNLLAIELDEKTTIKYPSPMQNEVTKRYAKELNGFRTALFHTHPRVFVENLKEIGINHLNFLKEEMNNGIYDYMGNDVNLNQVVNEVLSRSLSEADINVTPGNYHLLISPTSREDNPTAHLNFYRINSEEDYPSLIPLNIATKKEMQMLGSKFRGMRGVAKKWRLETFGFDILDYPNAPEDAGSIMWDFIRKDNIENGRRNDILKYGYPDDTNQEHIKLVI